MKILMVTSEAVPFAKSGGLADAVTALSRSLSRAGHEVKILMPRYYSIDRTALEPVEGGIGVEVGPGGEWGGLYRSTLSGSSVQVYFLEHERFFGRDGIYGNKTETDYLDNPLRFSFLSRAAFPFCRALGWIPDIIHAHDWPSALAPVYLRHAESKTEFAKTASVLSIHNLGYQGVYPKESYPFFRLPWELFHGAGLEFYDKVNLLKAGLASADCLATVSPTYAREIQTPDFGFGLDGLLRSRSADLVGILNGVDLDEWDPEADPHLPARYSAADLRGKAACKAALQKEFGLPAQADRPLFGMVTRLSEQKGIGELFGPLYGSAYRVCSEMEIQFAVLGSGERWCEAELASLSTRLPNFKARIGFDDRLSHLIEAGSDFFVMPSRYEPCGLAQMYSLRYGTLPVVHRTGGLADTVENYNQETGAGTGFMFDNLTPRAIYDTVGWATWAWYNRRAHVDAMRVRAMGRRFPWERSAEEYAKLYGRALERAAYRGA